MKRWRAFVFPGLVAVAFYVAVAGGEHSLRDAHRARAALEDRRTELAALRQEIDSLAAWSDSLRHHDEALERLARERYGFIRDGEYLYRISDGARGADDESPGETAGDPVVDSLVGGVRRR